VKVEWCKKNTFCFFPNATTYMEHSTDTKTNRIAWPTRTGFVFTGFDDIVFCQADGSYTKIWLISGSRITVSYKLKMVEGLLGGHPFFRVHDSTLVNLNCITALKREDGIYTLIIGEHEVTVAKARKKALINCFYSIYKLK
jgi:two-component system, LytTR family, response regulator